MCKNSPTSIVRIAATSLVIAAWLATPSDAQTCQHAWDTTSGDTSVGGGLYATSPLSGEVGAVAEFDDGTGAAVYAGGYFFVAGGTSVSSIAKWDGATWSDVGGGVSSSSAAFVSSMLPFDDGTGPGLYVGGQFSAAGGVSAVSIAKWDGANWSALGAGPCNGGCGGLVAALATFDDGTGEHLYAGGMFSHNGWPNHVAMWDGSTWSNLAGGVRNTVPNIPAQVRALATFDDGSGPALYVGGTLNQAGGLSVGKGIVRWDGSSWSSVGGGTNGDVFALAVHNDGSGPALYAGGSFTSAGGQAAGYLAKWDGNAWSSVGGGTNGWVFALEVFSGVRGDLYAGGNFTTANGVAVNGLGRWDGSQWSAVDGGVTGCGGSNCTPYVLALAAVTEVSDVGPALYAAGTFRQVGGASAERIACWTRNSYGGADSDGDGLYDYWEYCGIDVNEDGVVDLVAGSSYFSPDPLHKDIFIEIDAMYGNSPGGTLVQKMRAAFNGAPVNNPDNTTGIDLHVYTQHITHFSETYGWDKFDDIKEVKFGPESAWGLGNWPNIREAMTWVYHYCLYVDQFYRDVGTDPDTGETIWDDVVGSGEGGLGIAGNDFVISQGALDTSTWHEEAGVFMHELGHNLGLSHGGGDRINRKPNYKSVMNYTWTAPAGYGGVWSLNYSTRKQNTLHEGGLSETTNMDGDSGDIVVYGPGTDGDEYATSGATGQVDWDQDGTTDQSLVGANINALYENANSPSQETLVGHNDWANLVYNFRASGDFSDYVHQTVPEAELTQQIMLAMRGGEATCPAAGDDDASREDAATMDYNDDFMEKTLDLSTSPVGVDSAKLWIYGQPYNYAGQTFQPREDYRILVNGDPGQVLSFDVGAAFNEQTLIYQWVTFDVPPAWLVPGLNTFKIYTEKPFGTWDHNNLRVAVDTDNDQDRSWWCGNGVSGCNNPGLRNGELMIYLETCGMSRGDVDCDGTVDSGDLPLFVSALTEPATFTGCNIDLADLNGDGAINGLDIHVFVETLIGGG